MTKPLVLCILDGCGVREDSDGNAFKNASKPTFDYLLNKYPHSILQASGPSVGLPEGQMGGQPALPDADGRRGRFHGL